MREHLYLSDTVCPSVLCRAASDVQDTESLIDLVRVYPNGSCSWYPEFRSAAHCPMNIAWYPFDEQTCSLSYESWGHHEREVNLTTEHPAVNSYQYQSSSEWELIGLYKIAFVTFCTNA